jgi:hypothetical protein
MVRKHDVVALTEDALADRLHKGDVGAVVHCYRAGDLYEVEFIDERGRTNRIASIPASRLMKLKLLSLTA